MKPKLFIMGDEDNFTSISRFHKEFASIACICNTNNNNKNNNNNNNSIKKKPEDCTCVEKKVVKGVDHFWFGKEAILSTLILEWMNRVLEPPPSNNNNKQQ